MALNNNLSDSEIEAVRTTTEQMLELIINAFPIIAFVLITLLFINVCLSFAFESSKSVNIKKDSDDLSNDNKLDFDDTINSSISNVKFEEPKTEKKLISNIFDIDDEIIINNVQMKILELRNRIIEIKNTYKEIDDLSLHRLDFSIPNDLLIVYNNSNFDFAEDKLFSNLDIIENAIDDIENNIKELVLSKLELHDLKMNKKYSS